MSEEKEMPGGPWMTRIALAAFAVLLYWGVAADWWMPRLIAG